MNAVNVSAEMDKLLEKPETKGKRLLLHSCCAPCSSYVLMYLRKVFRITVLYYNPNITEEAEYVKRAREEKRFIETLNALDDGVFPIDYKDGKYEPDLFLREVRGYEDCPERGERCGICFRLRLGETAAEAAKGGFDYFATTLTLSPLKDATLINRIGQEEGKKAGCTYLPSDFKKKGGYLKSIELSKEYGLYRQDYCGCAFSKAERERQKELRKEEENNGKITGFTVKRGGRGF
ncbi:MAG: epoxyqueuosine reductase QueH [Lachnospiraceae bacterium]|nr:epoxyqueuosine reductase QueH [Lachnospiraceae bacterium]